MRLFEVTFSLYHSDSKQKNSNLTIRRFENKPFRTHQSVYACLINPQFLRHISLPFVREFCIAVFCVGVWCYRIQCTCPPHFESPILSDTSSDTVPRASLRKRKTPLQNCRTAHAPAKRSVRYSVIEYNRSSFWNGNCLRGQYGILGLNPVAVLYRRFGKWILQAVCCLFFRFYILPPCERKGR